MPSGEPGEGSESGRLERAEPTHPAPEEVDDYIAEERASWDRWALHSVGISNPAVHECLQVLGAGHHAWEERGWGPDGPPEEACSRVTNPERFMPLHDTALEILAALEQRFDVERVEGYGLDEELAIRALVRPTIALRPIDPEAAPITVAFTDFPGLSVRFGKWSTEWFPVCGCDACAEDAEGEIERLTERVDCVAAGGFRETVVYSPTWWKPGRWLGAKPETVVPPAASYAPLTEGSPRKIRGSWTWRRPRLQGSRLETAFDGPLGHRSRSGSLLDDDRAFRMSGGHRRLELNWKPWPMRQG